ncbi:MAG TPA: DUF177 domain-containing protein [Dongiaceae bacterium]|nr:DUF177 domain-containing protein [Dongiaceae bacterium]
MSADLEFSRPIEVERIAGTPAQFKFDADPAERAALADRFGLVSLDRFQASFTLRRLRKDLIRVKGHISASLVQACVVTLEPVPAEIAEELELDFSENFDDPGLEMDLDAEAADGPEPLSGGMIDLGEVAAEQLGLAIDPYPRKPGAEIPAEWAGDPTAAPVSEAKVNPFVELEKLTKKQGGR